MLVQQPGHMWLNEPTFPNPVSASVLELCHCSDTTELVPQMWSWVEALAVLLTGHCPSPLLPHLEVFCDNPGSVRARMGSVPDCGCWIATFCRLIQMCHSTDTAHSEDTPCFTVMFHIHSICCSQLMTFLIHTAKLRVTRMQLMLPECIKIGVSEKNCSNFSFEWTIFFKCIWIII